MTNKPLIPAELASRVLMVGVYYKHHAPGGMAAVVQYYSRYMAALHYVASWRQGNVCVRVTYALSAYVQIAFRLLTTPRLRLVHIHTAADGSFWRKTVYLRLAKALGRKVILHVHASRFKDFYHESPRKPEIVRRLRRADRLIVLSHSWKDWFEEIGIDKDKIVVLHNITDHPQLSPPTPADGRVHFLFLGEIGPRKGVFDLLRALSQHRKEFAGKMELRIGGNKNEDRLLTFIRQYELQDVVKFCGWATGEKKAALLRWADVFVLPSHNEGLPISILEAMSYGCAILSTPVGGIPEVVDPSNGLLVRPGCEEEIAEAIRCYVEQPDMIITQGKNSMEKVKTYLPASVMQALSAVYDEVLREGGGECASVPRWGC